ncbi:MAG: carboxy terminal-processing peptidase, partial [Verrucomicrobiota bacterium]
TGAIARLEPTNDMAVQTRWVVNTINARHYLRESMEKLDGAEMVEAYVKSFDYGKMYFTREEIDEFIFRFGESMEDILAKGNLYAAFEIYNNYKSHAQARTEWSYETLDGDFDFTVDETFAPDRRELEWPVDTEARDALWLKRIKYELLNEMMSLASEVKEGEGYTGEIENPDVIEGSDDEKKFDPSKIQRLVDDPEFHDEILAEAKTKIRRRYERNLSYTLDREAAEVQESFINSMTQLFDPHSSFLSADTLESFNSSVQNSFVGIGALLQDEDGICTIKQVLPGGPAEASRALSEEDEILGVAQGEDGEFEDVVDMQLRYIVRKIKGEKDTTVRLLIRPGDASDPSVRKVVSIVRGEVKLTANLATAKLVEVPTANDRTVLIGVIELPSFYGNIGAGNTLTTTTDDVAELLNKLRAAKAEGIVLDLRMNGGGLLSEAVRLAGLFIPNGPVVQVRDKDGRTNTLSDYNPTLHWDGPLVVLTSRFSASASEIVAGALQDHGRALVVGNSSTHGKGTVQEVYHMSDRPAFPWFNQATVEPTRPVASKITIKQFYLPGGSSTQVKGVVSDISLPSVNEFLPIGESDLPHALPWDEIPAARMTNNWEKLKVASADQPNLITTLSLASKARQESLPEFSFLKKQIDWRHKRIEEKEISIHLAKRIETKIREQAYIEQLDETYEALQEEDYVVTEFVLDVTEEQDALSKKNLSVPVKEGEEFRVESESEEPAESTEIAVVPNEEEEEDETPPYDIYLRESARIMADWILAVETPTETAKTTTTVEAF